VPRLWPQWRLVATTKQQHLDRKTASIRLRVSERHKRAFVAEAQRCGLALSSWMVAMCVQGLGPTPLKLNNGDRV